MHAQTPPAQTLLTQLKWRCAIKKFDPARKIPEVDWRALEEALVLTPSSYGLQPWKFLVVTNQELRERLVPLSWSQRQPADCSHLVVFTVKQEVSLPYIDRYVERIAEVRGVPKEKLASYRQMMVGSQEQMKSQGQLIHWATNQVFIALGNFMTCAALLGIDTCPMEGFDRAAYEKILALEGSGYSAVVLCAVGYRAADDACTRHPKVRFKPEELILHVR